MSTLTPSSYGFEAGSRLTEDACAQSARAAANDSVFGYRVANFRPQGAGQDHPRYMDFVLEHPSLHPTDGYGVPPPCVIDADSQFRNNPQREVEWGERRALLTTRTFHAAPNLGRGEPLPTLEHVLLAGQPSAACGATPGTLSSVETDLPPLNATVKQYVQTGADATDGWLLQFGEPSRDALRKMRAGVPQGACPVNRM